MILRFSMIFQSQKPKKWLFNFQILYSYHHENLFFRSLKFTPSHVKISCLIFKNKDILIR